MKTENLTFLEAIEAMKRGEVTKNCGCIRRIKNGRIEYWRKDIDEWEDSQYIYPLNPFTIVPDPSKPKQKESERLWQEYLSKVRRYHDGKPLVWERDTIDMHCNLIDYILARVREENET